MLCLDRLCEQKDFFKDLIENRQAFASACKNHISRSSAKMIKNALVQLRERSFPKTSSQIFQERQKNLTYTSRRKIFHSLEKRRTTIVSFAKNTVIFPEIVKTNLPKLLALFNIYNNLQCFLISKMLSSISLNRRNMMIIQHSSSQSQQMILR